MRLTSKRAVCINKTGESITGYKFLFNANICATSLCHTAVEVNHNMVGSP